MARNRNYYSFVVIDPEQVNEQKILAETINWGEHIIWPTWWLPGAPIAFGRRSDSDHSLCFQRMPEWSGSDPAQTSSS